MYPGKAEVGYISRPARQNLLIGGRHVSMRAEENIHPAVKISAERELLPRRLCVKIDSRNVILPIAACKYPVCTVKGIVGKIKPDPTREIYNENAHTLVFYYAIARARRVCGKICGTQYSVVIIHKIVQTLLSQRMIAARHDVCSRVEHCSRVIRR